MLYVYIVYIYTDMHCVNIRVIVVSRMKSRGVGEDAFRYINMCHYHKQELIVRSSSSSSSP